MPQPDSDMDSIYDALTDDEKKIIASVIRGADVTEIYSPVRVNQIAAKLGLVPGYSLDLTNGWDFTLEADRKRAWEFIKETKPYMLIGSLHAQCSVCCKSSIFIFIETTQPG